MNVEVYVNTQAFPMSHYPSLRETTHIFHPTIDRVPQGDRKANFEMQSGKMRMTMTGVMEFSHFKYGKFMFLFYVYIHMKTLKFELPF